MDVNNVVNHKRTLSLECVIPSESKQFQFPDVDSAKKAFRMAVLQNTFFRKYESSAAIEARNTTVARPDPVFHQTPNPEDRIDLDLVDHHYQPQQQLKGSFLQLSQRAQSTSCLDLSSNPAEVDRLRTLLPSYRPAPDYETAVQQKYRNSAGALPQVSQITK